MASSVPGERGQLPLPQWGGGGSPVPRSAQINLGTALKK